ncbi:hypothetical protein IHE45_15G064400 [Dioscorea alata]|uniref:Uncharacterized protein n=1 Tax=Dioscorea alata TaxID=55571 RepID=A0ACB7ULP8_DIOAL|nr:hypothetical protein IHE45_15G064400 [Dioscorea alata]
MNEILDDGLLIKDPVNFTRAAVERTPPWIDVAIQTHRDKANNPPNLPNPDISEIGADSPWMIRVRTKVNKRRGRAHAKRPCTIFKVQDNNRGCNPDAYTPLVVSIGPYHHHQYPDRNSNFKAMKNHKWLCLRRLLFRHRSRRGATELLDRCLLEMKSLDADVRSCYSESSQINMDAQSLAMVMLLDGCFILHLLVKQQNLINHVSNKDRDNDDDDEVKDGEILLELGDGDEDMEQEPLLRTLWIWNFVLYDLLKLENQIPFFVLTTLFDLLKVPSDEGVDLVNLSFKLFSDIHPSKTQTFPILPAADQVHHLLHLFHSSLVPSNNDHVLDIPKAVKAPEWIPNATELHQAGVKFVKKENAGSFLDISFSSNGTMEIPELCLYDHTEPLFRNLIAFEQCYPDTRTYVTIFGVFMDCLIDTPKDIRSLHLNGILTNGLSTDEAAADLFNKLCYQIHYAFDRNYLHELFVDVNKYYNSRWNQWRAKLMRDYFSNPWAIISLMAAVMLLLLTVVQSFFAAYSYFRPP